MLTTNNNIETESQETLNKIWFAGNYHAVVHDRALFRRNSKQWKVCWCRQVQLLLTLSRQNLLMVAWGQAAKIAHSMSPCLCWQDFFPIDFIKILQSLALMARFFWALTQGLFPFLSLPIFEIQTFKMFMWLLPHIFCNEKHHRSHLCWHILIGFLNFGGSKNSVQKNVSVNNSSMFQYFAKMFGRNC